MVPTHSPLKSSWWWLLYGQLEGGGDHFLFHLKILLGRVDGEPSKKIQRSVLYFPLKCDMVWKFSNWCMCMCLNISDLLITYSSLPLLKPYFHLILGVEYVQVWSLTVEIVSKCAEVSQLTCCKFFFFWGTLFRAMGSNILTSDKRLASCVLDSNTVDTSIPQLLASSYLYTYFSCDVVPLFQVVWYHVSDFFAKIQCFLQLKFSFLFSVKSPHCVNLQFLLWTLV